MTTYDVTYVPISKRTRRRIGKAQTVEFSADAALSIEQAEKLFEKKNSDIVRIAKVVDIRTRFKL
jgi:hypothetical protein